MARPATPEKRFGRVRLMETNGTLALASAYPRFGPASLTSSVGFKKCFFMAKGIPLGCMPGTTATRTSAE